MAVAFSPTASAHTLSDSKAKNRIRAYGSAETWRLVYHTDSPITHFTLANCSRVSGHEFACTVTFRRSGGGAICGERVSAYFPRHSSWVARHRVSRSTCPDY